MGINILLLSFQNDPDVIGLKSIHYFLRSNGHNSSILFLAHCDVTHGNGNILKQFIEKFSPDLIGIGLMSHEFLQARDVCQWLTAHFPRIPIIMGGIHPTLAPEECLDSGAEYVCIGEGEYAIVDLAAAIEGNLPTQHINNLIYRDKEKNIIRNPLYPLIQDLDSLPAYEHIPVNSYIFYDGIISSLTKTIFNQFHRHLGTHYAVLSSRGCPYQCTYCCNNFISGLYGTTKIRRRSVDSVIRELSVAIRDYPEIETINFADDCFLAANIKEIIHLSDLYKDLVGKPFIIRSIPTYITEEKISVLKTAGLSWVLIGLQSGSDRIVKDVYKRKSLSKHFLKASSIIHHSGVAACYDIIMDNPYETDEDRWETVYLLMQLPKPFFVDFFSLNFYRGTEIYIQAVKDGLISDASESLRKDYKVLDDTTLNRIIRIAPFVPVLLMKILVHDHNKQEFSIISHWALKILRVVSSLLFEPITYIRLIYLSQNKSIQRTGHAIMIYIKILSISKHGSMTNVSKILPMNLIRAFATMVSAKKS
ncbi:MAG: cobalamin-dependent protein [Magnetococcales bacterium]|nr:cobalamin-dependent protein [Magnetococcales bacterium]